MPLPALINALEDLIWTVRPDKHVLLPSLVLVALRRTAEILPRLEVTAAPTIRMPPNVKMHVHLVLTESAYPDLPVLDQSPAEPVDRRRISVALALRVRYVPAAANLVTADGRNNFATMIVKLTAITMFHLPIVIAPSRHPFVSATTLPGVPGEHVIPLHRLSFALPLRTTPI